MRRMASCRMPAAARDFERHPRASVCPVLFRAGSARPLFEAMGKSILATGPAGSGHAVQALNNHVSAAGLRAACEAAIIAARSGIDGNVRVDVLNAPTGRSKLRRGEDEALRVVWSIPPPASRWRSWPMICRQPPALPTGWASMQPMHKKRPNCGRMPLRCSAPKPAIAKSIAILPS